jgi:tRNA pseudouridine55 synthase
MTDGALLLDKPLGLSSNAALQRAKKLLGARKAGHAGTLDPLASGLLIVVLGEATKFAGLLLDQDKEYLAALKLGEKTSTGDAEGEVLERKAVAVDEPQVASVLARFRGDIEQVPPMHSALKRDGVPLYKLARKGMEVARERRRVRIREIELLKQEKDLLEIRVVCSKGTYIRVLAEDIGAALGTCAHLGALRRTASGGFRIEGAIGLEALEALEPLARSARLLPLAALLADLPRVDLDSEAAARLRNGQTLKISGLQDGLVAAYKEGGGLIGLARAADGGLQPLRLTQAADLHR